MDLVVYTQYYRCKTADRQLEIDECLRRNLNHPGISKVVLFKESDAPPLPQASVPLEVVESNERITYAEWFRWVKRQGSGIGLLLNADIYLDEGLAHLAASFDSPETFLALTRYNPGHAGFHLNDYPHWTQDVWGVRADAELPESLLYASSFPLGFPGCDNRIAYVMWSHGFRVRNPCYHVRSVHLQASTARSYDKTSDRLYGGVSYVHPSLSPDEDAELEFTVWTRSQQRPAGVLVNQQAIEQGVHQLRHGEAEVAQRFLDLQQFTGLSWMHEAVGSAHLQGDLHPFASEDTVFLPMPALLGDGVELQLQRPTKLEGLTLRLPRRAAAGYKLELEAQGEGDAQLLMQGDGALALKPGGERRFWQAPELKGEPWQRLRLKLTDPVTDPSWRDDEGAELVLFGEEGALEQAKSLSVIAEEPSPATSVAESAEPAYQWRRCKDCEAQLAAAEELHSYGRRFRVLRSGDELLFDDRFWPSVGVSPIAAVPCGLDDAKGLLLWGFGQPCLELRPDQTADTKRHINDVSFWQYPCRTEGDAFAVHQALKAPQLKDDVLHMYVGLPWATWIDRSSWPEPVMKSYRLRIDALRSELKAEKIDLKVHTVCQHILWQNFDYLFKSSGIDSLWLSHKPSDINLFNGLELHAWHLYAVNAREANRQQNLCIKPIARRPWRASFIGAHMGHYITEVRLQLKQFKDLHRFHIHLQDEWHFNPIVYGEQVADPGQLYRQGVSLNQVDKNQVIRVSNPAIDNNMRRYNVVLSDTIFSLCPAGAGPNSLRLWESLAIGCIPVIISDELVLPDILRLSQGRFSNWSDIVLFHPEGDLETLPSRLEAMESEEIEQRSASAIEITEYVNCTTCLVQHAGRTLPSLKREDNPDPNKPRIVIPMYGPGDGWFWRKRKHGFYNVVLEWYLRGYVTISFGWQGYFWWGKEGDILLMERDNVHDLLDRKKDPPRWQGEVPYKHAFFFNQYHLANGRNHTATYFTYAPDHLEKVRATLGRLRYKQRNHASIFAGSIENETQEFFRNRFRDWEEAIDIYSCADKLNHNEPHRYTVDEYLQLVATSRFGVSFRGNGPKCFREMEYLAFGTPLIITEGIEVNYPDPLVEHVHYFRADRPEDIQRIAESTSEETWEQMSQACWDWFERNGTLDQMFTHLKQQIESLDLNAERHKLVRIAASREQAEHSLAARSLAIADPQAQWVAEEEAGETSLVLKPEDLVVNELPFVDQEDAYAWRVVPDEQRAYTESILNSDLDVHKSLLELLGLRLRNFRITLEGPTGIIPLWDRLEHQQIVLRSDQERALLQIDFDWSRRCSVRYIDRQFVINGPGAVTFINVAEATLHYENEHGNNTADLTDQFNDYYAMHGVLIPEEKVIRVCKLWQYGKAKFNSISGHVIIDRAPADRFTYANLKW
jgi:hypothetical protein